MEKTIYRNNVINSSSNKSTLTGTDPSRSTATLPPLSPGCFYPLMTATEEVTWRHWLPTVLTFPCRRMSSPSDVLITLTHRGAPAEIIEEFHWCWNIELFDAYEVRLPGRRDMRDPLLIGRLGTQRYRIALWGESLQPMETITALVQQSLVIRRRATLWRAFLLMSGTLLGLLMGLWLGPLLLDVSPGSAGFVLALFGFFVLYLSTSLWTPASRQQDFLDLYRR